MVSVSIIIPVYNAELYLERCLDSVCNQTLKDIEIICIDDCSTDNSAKILLEYSKKYPSLKVVTHKINKGESGARNTGLSFAKGEFLGFVDNDDSVDLDFYEKLYNIAKRDSADIAKAELHEIGYDGKDGWGNLNKRIRESKSNLFFTYHWWTAIYKTDLIRSNNIKFLEGYPLGGDVLFLNKALLATDKKISLVDDSFYHYYRRENSGDSLILSFEKVKSVLSIHEMIMDNLILAESKLNDSIGVREVSNWCLNATINYAYRNKTVENLAFCIDKLFAIYKKARELNSSNFTPENILPIVFSYVEHGDKKGLIELFKKNDSRQKMFLANLRYIHQKREVSRV